MYVSMYHLFCVCHFLVPEIDVCSEMLCVFQYVDMNHMHVVKTVEQQVLDLVVAYHENCQ